MSCCEKITFKLGEKKYVRIEVKSCNGQPFDVTKAWYILRNSDEIEAEGDCLIQTGDGSTILEALVQPMIKNAVYTLDITYEIPPEILIYSAMIQTT
nr:MAG TPA: hypothetical protein [Caudoviricetes sp.]